MGRYIRWGSIKKPSISRALEEAEEDHFLGCPEAPLVVRSAAFVADTLLLATLLSTLNRLMVTLFVFLGLVAEQAAYPPWIASLIVASDFTVWYFYSIWTTYEFGGSPVKLLFNLRVVDVHTGGRLELHQLFLREWFAKPIGLGLALASVFFSLYRNDRRALHDLICRSSVKKIDEASR